MKNSNIYTKVVGSKFFFLLWQLPSTMKSLRFNWNIDILCNIFLWLGQKKTIQLFHYQKYYTLIEGLPHYLCCFVFIWDLLFFIKYCSDVLMFANKDKVFVLWSVLWSEIMTRPDQYIFFILKDQAFVSDFRSIFVNMKNFINSAI